MPLHYSIDATEPGQRRLGVTLEFEVDARRIARDGGDRAQQLFLPTWTPGSYLIREYSRHVSRVVACDATNGSPLPCRKVSKNRFEIHLAAETRRLRVSYSVYAHDLSVRTADLTGDHAYWNHACVLLWPAEEPHRAARIDVAVPADWRVASSLPRDESPNSGRTASGANTTTLLARDLDHAMDSPVLTGTFERIDWSIGGVPHTFVFDDLGGVRPPASLIADMTAIVDAAQAVFGGALPYENYTFLCLCTTDGHGGLEHADSTTLLVSRTAFGSDKSYREFLALAAHELFHAWNVKRMRPVEFWRYDYESENYTEMLWLIEGWTAYYDDLLCVRAGAATRADYLAILARNVGTMRAGPGRRMLSLRESSFDAWIRLYRPDENTRNSSQNYYVNGAVAALCVDLWLRSTSAGSSSLDTVMRELWRQTFERGRGYTLADVHNILRQQSGEEAVAMLEALVGDQLDPDVEALLAKVGVRAAVAEAGKPHLGVTFEAGGTLVASVAADSAASAAGIAPGDELLAVNGLRVDANRWSDIWKAIARVREPLEILFARRGVIGRCEVVPAAGPPNLNFEFVPDPSDEQRRLQEAWLGSGRPARAAASAASQ